MPIDPTEDPPIKPGQPTEPPPESPPGNPRPEMPPPTREPGESPTPEELPGRTPEELPVRGPQGPTTPSPATDTSGVDQPVRQLASSNEQYKTHVCKTAICNDRLNTS